MSTATTKLAMGSAAIAIAIAGVITPATVAQARPGAPVLASGVGGAAVSAQCDPVSSVCAAPIPLTARSSVGIGAHNTIFQNPLWWFGAPNPNPPVQRIVTFYPLALLPGFIRPLLGWVGAVNFQACIGGLTIHVGPYGAISGSVGRGCA